MVSNPIDTGLLKAHHDGLYVTIRDTKAEHILKEVGYYGVELANILRKETYRRGQLDIQLSTRFGLDTCPLTILDLTEAFYLLDVKRCLSVSTLNPINHDLSTSDTLKPSSDSWWQTFRDVYKNSGKRLDFAIEYCVYSQFRSQGWIVKNGFNYGVDFLLYKNDPSEEHSQYAITIISEVDHTNSLQNRYTWKSLLAFHRVIQSVNKKYLLVYVTTNVDQSDIDLTSRECFNKMTINTRLFTASSNTLK